jgi:hypothetical protein
VCSLIECGPTEATNSHAKHNTRDRRCPPQVPTPNKAEEAAEALLSLIVNRWGGTFTAMLLMLLFMPYYSLIESKRAFEPNRGLVALCDV